jgi:glutamine synthetase
VLTRQAIYAIAANFGCKATLIPKPFAMQAGNASHFHMSLNKSVEPFIAGILHHLPALMPILAPLTNSYERIGPQVPIDYSHIVLGRSIPMYRHGEQRGSNQIDPRFE